jgi:hypothetical protein
MNKLEKKQNIGEWEAWTHPKDFVPHIYVKGTVPTNGEKPIFKLKVANQQGIVEKQLILELAPDQIDSNGKQSATVEDFNTPTIIKKYESVLIRTESVNPVAVVQIITKER